MCMHTYVTLECFITLIDLAASSNAPGRGRAEIPIIFFKEIPINMVMGETNTSNIKLKCFIKLQRHHQFANAAKMKPKSIYILSSTFAAF